MRTIKKRFNEPDILEALDFLRIQTNEGRALTIAEFARDLHIFKEAAEIILWQLVARNVADYKYRPKERPTAKKYEREFFACFAADWEPAEVLP